MKDLQRKAVFMSASYPSGERLKKFGPKDPGEITIAVLDFSRWVLKKNGTLTTAAHPVITPMLVYTARVLGVKNSLTVYRSDWYESKWVPELNDIEKDKLGFVKRTKKVENQEKSLNIMRRTMIQDSCYAGALFIGGMEDVETEYAMFSEFHPDSLRAPVRGTGGVAACLP